MFGIVNSLKTTYLNTGIHCLKLTCSTLSLSGIESPPRDYSIPGEGASKIFEIIGASANLVFAYNTGMLPEIQVG